MSTETITIRVTPEEKNAFKSYAERYNTTLSEIIRNAMAEKLEDEYDLKVYEEYLKEKEAGTLEVTPIEELFAKYGL